MKALLLILTLLTVASCATRKMTRHEWLSVTNKTYSDVSKEEFIKANEYFFKLLDDESDLTIAHHRDGMVVSRNWLLYFVIGAAMGTDTWHITAKEKDGKLNVHLAINRLEGSVTGVPGGAYTSPQTVTAPSMVNAINGPISYETYWKRMDFLLGRSETWYSCKDIEKDLKNEKSWGRDDPVCSVTLPFYAPKSVNKKEKERLNMQRVQNKYKFL